MLVNILTQAILSISAIDYLAIMAVWAGSVYAIRFGMWPYSLIGFPGVFAHEAMHYMMAKLFFASPNFPNMIPRKNGDSWIMGSVSFVPSLINSIPLAMAPLLLLPASIWMAAYMLPTVHGWAYAGWVWAIGSALHACMPSNQDWKIALPGIGVATALTAAYFIL